MRSTQVEQHATIAEMCGLGYAPVNRWIHSIVKETSALVHIYLFAQDWMPDINEQDGARSRGIVPDLNQGGIKTTGAYNKKIAYIMFEAIVNDENLSLFPHSLFTAANNRRILRHDEAEVQAKTMISGTTVCSQVRVS